MLKNTTVKPGEAGGPSVKTKWSSHTTFKCSLLPSSSLFIAVTRWFRLVSIHPSVDGKSGRIDHDDETEDNKQDIANARYLPIG